MVFSREPRKAAPDATRVETPGITVRCVDPSRHQEIGQNNNPIANQEVLVIILTIIILGCVITGIVFFAVFCKNIMYQYQQKHWPQTPAKITDNKIQAKCDIIKS